MTRQLLAGLCLVFAVSACALDDADSTPTLSGDPLAEDSTAIARLVGDTQTPWSSNATGTLYLDQSWNYAMGYHFTPKVDGFVTNLGGFFRGAKTVKLFDTATG